MKRFIFGLLIISLFIYSIHRRANKEKMLKSNDISDGHIILNQLNQQQVSPKSDNVYFHLENLKIGNKIPIYFSLKNLSKTPHLLPRNESDSIPFSLSNISQILDLFSFPKKSAQAKAMANTLRECEHEPLKGETKFCATSLESMLDSIGGVFGLDTKFKPLTTNFVSNHSVELQNYIVLEGVKEVMAPKMLACHTMPYPYRVYYCHGQKSDHKLFEIKLEGDNGERVDALGVCHVDTSQWDPNHAAFRVLGTRPGLGPVCHFFPDDNLVWVVSNSSM